MFFPHKEIIMGVKYEMCATSARTVYGEINCVGRGGWWEINYLSGKYVPMCPLPRVLD